MRLLKLRNAANENRPIYINPNRITAIEPVTADRSTVRTQDGEEYDILASGEELERRFEEITQPGKQKVLRSLQRHLHEDGGIIGLRLTKAMDPADYDTLHRFLEEHR